MGSKESEACGRCAMSATAGAMDDQPDPYGGDHVEVDAADARAVSPAAWVSGLATRLDDWATRLTYGR